MEHKTYDAEGAVLGRMATEIVKELLKGKTVEIINAEKTIISGNKKSIIEKIQRKRKMGSGGSLKGPRYIRSEDRLLKRMIRGMLPRDRPKGREAIKRLTCHIGNKKHKEKETINTFKHKKPMIYTTLQEVAGGLQ